MSPFPHPAMKRPLRCLLSAAALLCAGCSTPTLQLTMTVPGAAVTTFFVVATTTGFSTTTVFSTTVGVVSTMTGAGRGSTTARTRFTMSVASRMPLAGGSW